MITVKHKAGKAWPNLRAVIYCVRKLTFARAALITIEYDGQIAGADTGGIMWLKIAGLRSGWKTQSNNEELAAFRVDQATRTVEFCNYERRGGKLAFKNRFVSSYRRVMKHSIYVKRERFGAMRWPAWPWAEGGGEFAKGDFCYRLHIKRIS